MQNNPRISERRDRKKWILAVVALVAIAAVIAIALLVLGGSSSGKGEGPLDEELVVSAQTPEPAHTPVPFVSPEPTPAEERTGKEQQVAVGEEKIPTPTPEPIPVPTTIPKPEPKAVLTVVPTPKPTPVPISIPTPLPRPKSTPAPESTPTPTPEPTFEPTPVSTRDSEPEEVRIARFVPMDEFGEVFTAGSVELELPGRHFVDAKYTYQVKSTGEFTLFFSLHDDSPELLWEIRIRDYSQGGELKNAEIIQYYRDGAVRVTGLNRSERSITVAHNYKLDPYPENIFSASSRLELNKEEMTLLGRSASSLAKVHFDLSGFSDREGWIFTGYSQSGESKEVEAAFGDIEALVSQIEEKRKRNR